MDHSTLSYEWYPVLAANFWNQTPDPWLDPVTFISGFDCSDGYVLNGEGSLYIRETGQEDIQVSLM